MELGLSASATPETRFDANYTYFGFDVRDATTLPGDELIPNAPRHRGSVAASYLGGNGLELGATARFAESFDWSAGVFAGNIPSSQTVDLRISYRVGRNTRIHAVATNVFDQQRFHAYGGSVIGRRIITGVTVTY